MSQTPHHLHPDAFRDITDENLTGKCARCGEIEHLSHHRKGLSYCYPCTVEQCKTPYEQHREQEIEDNDPFGPLYDFPEYIGE